MQRWKLLAAIAIAGLVLAAVGGTFALREYRAEKPSPIWVPLALRPDISMAEQKELAEKIEANLRKKAVLRKIVEDVRLQEKYGVADVEAAVAELDRRLFVRPGKAETPQGVSVPSVNVGVEGTKRDQAISEQSATRIIKDVWKMLGIDPETGKEIGGVE